jgi:undecaprenyl diphosphate synthase
MNRPAAAPDDTVFAAACRAAGLDPARLPRHLAVIMDGNGRWARRRGWQRFLGHEHGVAAVRAAVTASARLGIPRLTLYAFSSENWSRPEREIRVLMDLLDRFLVNERPLMMDQHVRLHAAGRLERLPAHVRERLAETIALTAGNDGLQLTLALSYGGRDELVDACKALAAAAASGELDPADITAEHLQSQLYPAIRQDVDLVVRTAGEQRLSNFLPWQAAYAEFVSLDLLWPDLREEHLLDALRQYSTRERRFGGVPEQTG